MNARRSLPLSLSLLLSLPYAAAAAALPSFPGAEGPGMFASGGRGGHVYRVTFPAGASSVTLSLAALPTATDNRTVVLTLPPGARDHFIGCASRSLVVIRR